MSNNTTVVVGPGNTIAVSAPGPQGPAGTGGSGGVTDGDKGSIVVSNSGATWTLDTASVATGNLQDDAVTFAKLQNVTGPTLIGRSGSGAGNAEQIGIGTGLEIDGSKNLSVTGVVGPGRRMVAGTGLTGGGDLSSDRTFDVDFASSGTTSTTKAVRADDSRLSDARTPTAHTHALADIQQGGATSGQVLEWSGSAWAPATLSGGGGGTVTSVTAGTGLTGGTITASGTIAVSYGTTAGTACQGNDSRLSDARTPTSHTHAAADINSGTLDIARIPTGSSGTTVCVGNDARLSDARTPSAHTHGLTDSYVGEIAAAADQTYTIDRYVAFGRTITDIRIQSTSGTCSAAVKNGADTVGTVSVSSTSGGSSPSLSNATVAQNGAITLVISSNSSAVNVSFAIRYTAVTGAIS